MMLLWLMTMKHHSKVHDSQLHKIVFMRSKLRRDVFAPPKSWQDARVFEEKRHIRLIGWEDQPQSTTQSFPEAFSYVPSSIFLMSYFKLSYLRRRESFFRLSYVMDGSQEVSCIVIHRNSTMAKPAKISLTNAEILIGSSKLPIVTELTARRD